jgi:hypothetical protein
VSHYHGENKTQWNFLRKPNTLEGGATSKKNQKYISKTERPLVSCCIVADFIIPCSFRSSQWKKQIEETVGGFGSSDDDEHDQSTQS